MTVKNTVLLGLRQAREQRQHLGTAQCRLVLQVLAQVVGRFADFALTGQEDQNVAALGAAVPQLVHGIGHSVVEVKVFLFLKRAVAHLHRVGTARHHDHRRGAVWACKVLGETIRIDGGRGDHHLQIWPLGQDLLEVAQQEVNVQAALVGLVNDQRVVGFEQRIGLRLSQQNTVGHQLDRGIFLQRVLKTHLVAHQIAQRGVQLFGNALGDRAGRNTARLRVANQVAAHVAVGIGHLIDLAPPQRQRNLGQLRGFSRAGFTTDNDDLVLVHRLHDFFTAAGYGQGLGERDLQRHKGRNYPRSAPTALHAGLVQGRKKSPQPPLQGFHRSDSDPQSFLVST